MPHGDSEAINKFSRHWGCAGCAADSIRAKVLIVSHKRFLY